MSACKTCGAYLFPTFVKQHTCHPTWLVWDPDNGDEDSAKKVYALDAEDAAEKFIENSDYATECYSTLERDGVLVHVRGLDQSLTKVRVTAETTIEYSANIEEPSEGDT